MRLETLTCLCALVAVTWAQGAYFGAGREVGRINARLQARNYKAGAQQHHGRNRDAKRIDDAGNSRARWSGQNALRENGVNQNEHQLQDRARAANQNFGRFSNNFGNIAKQIRDEALRNSYVIKDEAQTNKANLNSAQGANAANARKTAFDRGEQLDDNINYAFTKKFEKASSENGGYEEENGRNLKKVDVIDEREKDKKLVRGDSAVSRQQSDKAQEAKDTQWGSKAAQSQAQDAKFAFGDRRVDQAGERSDDRAVDYDRKDSRYLEQESGRDEAVRLAKDLAAQAAGYDNKALATADANRGVADKSYYGGKELAPSPNAVVGHEHHGYDDPTVAAAANAATADKAKTEGSGGVVRTGFDENALQSEKGNELASAKALSSAEAINDYKRNKDKLAYDQVRGLRDKTQGQFKQGLQDAASTGFSGNQAQAAKQAEEFDKAAAAKSSSSDLSAKERNENEALRDRDYYRKIQNDDSETFTRRKQFFHNKKDKGNNDEKLNYIRKKNARNFGAADEADLSKQNSFQNLHQNAKTSNAKRNFEDLTDKRSSQKHENQARKSDSNGFDQQAASDKATAQAGSTGQSRALSRANKDDSQSQQQAQREYLQDDDDSTQRVAKDDSQNDHQVKADVQYVAPTNGNPLGDVSSKDFLPTDLLRGKALDKGPKKIPDLVVDIKPLAPPPKIKKPAPRRPIAPIPPVTQIKTYHKPKYNKPEVNYDTGRPSNFGQYRPSFSRIPHLSLFKGPKKSALDTKAPTKPKSRLNLDHFQSYGPATSSFGRRNLLGGGSGHRFGGYLRGSFRG